MNKYKGLFTKGFEKSVFEQITNGNQNYNSLLTRCLNNPNLFQLNALNSNVLEKKLNDIDDNSIPFSSFLPLLNNYNMSFEEADKYLIELVPKLENLIKIWRESYMCVMNVTSVGTMLAYINLKRKTGLHLDINIWIK